MEQNESQNLNEQSQNLNNLNFDSTVIFDYLISPIFFYNDTFWENIPVGLEDDTIDLLKNVVKNENCIICTNKFNDFKELWCCSQIMCIGCSHKWFRTSVYCPFCKNDMRETI